MCLVFLYDTAVFHYPISDQNAYFFFSTSHKAASNKWRAVNNELEITGEKAVFNYFRYFFSLLLLPFLFFFFYFCRSSP